MISIRTGKRKLIALAASLAILTCIIVFVPRSDTSGSSQIAYSRQAETADQRIAFLKQFGWQVEPEPLEIRDVTIPEEFDRVYERYNRLQQAQGMDLLPYAGKTCRQWIYQVTNHPEDSSTVRAVLLVYEGEVIGGDISSVAIDGFITGFGGEKEPPVSSETAV